MSWANSVHMTSALTLPTLSSWGNLKERKSPGCQDKQSWCSCACLHSYWHSAGLWFDLSQSHVWQRASCKYNLQAHTQKVYYKGKTKHHLWSSNKETYVYSTEIRKGKLLKTPRFKFYINIVAHKFKVSKWPLVEFFWNHRKFNVTWGLCGLCYNAWQNEREHTFSPSTPHIPEPQWVKLKGNDTEQNVALTGWWWVCRSSCPPRWWRRWAWWVWARSPDSGCSGPAPLAGSLLSSPPLPHLHLPHPHPPLLQPFPYFSSLAWAVRWKK